MSTGRVATSKSNIDHAAAVDDNILRAGMAAIEQQRLDEAERIARDVLVRRPQHPPALQLLGVALLAQKRAREAVAPLSEAARDTTDPIIETQLAAALRKTGRTAEALTWLERATSRQPAFVPAFHELGIVLCSMRRFADAQAALERGLAIKPTAAELSVELGGVFINRADPDNAKIAFARALAQVPGHPRALHGFGTALLFEGEFERAAERFRQVLARNPGHVRARLDLGHCLLELGRWDEAVACLRAMMAATPRLYGKALQVLVSAGRGRFWLRPSAAAEFLKLGSATAPAGGQPPP
jgi:tetratricopeptide (TPR) repeat protein